MKKCREYPPTLPAKVKINNCRQKVFWLPDCLLPRLLALLQWLIIPAVSFPVTAAGPRRILTCFPDAADSSNIFNIWKKGKRMGVFFKKVHRIVSMIPPGTVMTYGQIAAMAGNPLASRAVGYALRAIPAGMELPWHRVVNSKGEISSRRTVQGDYGRSLQRVLLESEGIVFSDTGIMDLKKYQVF